jgi:hypothetical protein
MIFYNILLTETKKKIGYVQLNLEEITIKDSTWLLCIIAKVIYFD